MNPIPTIPILNIPMYAGPLPSAADMIVERCLNTNEKNNFRITATGAHGLVTAKKNPEFKHTLSSCFLNLPDGMPAVWIGKLKGARAMERCYGPDFFKAVIERSAPHPIKHFFCGGKPGVAEQLKTVCERTMQKKQVTGSFSPPFRDMTELEMKDLGTQITACNTHILWIGLSTPKQELFAQQIAAYTKVCFIITIGAAFDFFTGNVRQAPRAIQRSGLEWLFRLCIEPKRLFKRYAVIVPLFIVYNVLDLLTGISPQKR